MKRVKLRSPEYDHSFRICNNGLRQAFRLWYFNPDYETACQLENLDCDICYPKLNDILQLVGSYASLWIGDWQGTIAPMDVAGQGWTYPSGQPLEPEWWWQWHPCDRTEAKLLSLLNMNPIEAWTVDAPFKFGIPFQTQQTLGKVSAIDAIPMMRLPSLVRKDVEWIFEFER